MRLRSIGPAALLWVLAVGLGGQDLAAQLGRVEIGTVAFDGNVAFPDDSLSLAIVTRESECRALIFSPFCWLGSDFALQRFFLRDGQVQRDQLRLRVWYGTRGFRETQVDTATTLGPDGLAMVRFSIDEGPPIRMGEIQVVGLDELDYPELTDDLPIEAGDRLSNIALDATRDTLTRRLQDRGHAYADVLRSSFIPADDPYQARVTFDVSPGPRARYGPVTVTGQDALDRSTVLNTLQFAEGDLYRREQLIGAQGRLFGLDILRNASVAARLSATPDSIVPVDVRVVEGDAYRVRYGAGWSSSECLAAEASWSSRNFLGGGRIVQVRGRVSNILTPQFRDVLCWQGGTGEFADPTGLVSIDFAQPWIFSTRNQFAASLFGERESLPDVYVREAFGLDIALTRFIGPTTPLTAYFRPELSRLEAADALFCSGFLVCTPEDIAILEDRNWIAPLGLAFNRRMVNNPLNATRGYSTRLEVEHASSLTGSDFRFDRVTAEATRYWPFGASGVLAGHVRAGWVGVGRFSGFSGAGDGDVIPPQKRFYAGGANSVRGVAQSRLGPGVLQVRTPGDLLGAGVCSPAQLMDLSCDASGLGEGALTPRPTGGTRVAEASLEVRFGLGSSFQGVTFADIGQLWGADEGLSLAELEVTPGVGVRFLSPIGPIRLDLAYRFQGGQDMQVVTRRLRGALPGDAADDIFVVAGEAFAFSDELAILTPRVLFGDSGAFSYRRLQLHLSIGQAF